MSSLAKTVKELGDRACEVNNRVAGVLLWWWWWPSCSACCVCCCGGPAR